MLMNLPLDIWHGDTPDYLDKVASLKSAEDIGIMSKDQVDKLDDNDFSLIVVNKKKPSQCERFFPRTDNMHSVMSLMSLIKHKEFMPDELFKEVLAKILSSISSEFQDNPEIKKMVGNVTKIKIKAGPVTYLDDEEKAGDNSPIHIVKPKYKKTYVLDTGDKKYVPIDTEEEVKEAAHFLRTDAKKMDPRIYEYAHEKIAARIKELGLDEDEIPVYKLANGAEDEILRRVKLVKKLALRKDYAALAKRINDVPPLKLASMLTAIDEKANLGRFWGERIRNPLEAITDAQKLASYYQYVHGKGNARFKVTESDLIDAAADQGTLQDIEKYLGPHVKEEFYKLPVDVFKHLPEKYKGIIANIIKGKSGDSVVPKKEEKATNEIVHVSKPTDRDVSTVTLLGETEGK